MKYQKVFGLVFVCFLVGAASGQTTAQENYKKALAEEFISGNSRNFERVAHINEAFDLMEVAAESDGKYMEAFSRITGKYILRNESSNGQHYYHLYGKIMQLGKFRAGSPIFKDLVKEIFVDYQGDLSRKGFSPSKPFVQMERGRSHPYCNVPTAADQIYHLSLFVYPRASFIVKTWGKYAADLHMTVLKGCGGEGSDTVRNPQMAFPIYLYIGDAVGIYRTGKMLGDEWMEKYLFGGSSDTDYVQRNPGYRPFYEKSLRFYREGGIPKNDIRATILKLQRTAEKNNYSRDRVELAKKTLTETF